MKSTSTTTTTTTKPIISARYSNDKNDEPKKSNEKEQIVIGVPIFPLRFMLIDCESPDGINLLSEVFMLLIEWDYKKQEFLIIDNLHLFCAVNTAFVDRDKCYNIYKNVTGLSFGTLNKIGLPYNQVIIQVHAFLTKYANAYIVARDPRLDAFLLCIENVYEILNFLQQPYCIDFYWRKNRPEDISKYAQSYECEHHEPLLNGKPVHCAKVDVYIMYYWLAKYGLMLLYC